MRLWFLLPFFLVAYPLFSTSEIADLKVEEGVTSPQVINFANLKEYRDKYRVPREEIPFLPIPQDLPVDQDDIVRTELEEPPIQEDEKYITRAFEVSPEPTITFRGLDDSFVVIPPDTQGTVGLLHVMTTLNDRIGIQLKNGTSLRVVNDTTFWGVSSNVFDPKVMYDSINHRWTLVALTNGRSSDSRILIAVSMTQDPLGDWFIFNIRADDSGVTWADFPSIGFNNKWIVIQTNMFNVNNGSFEGTNILVFNKAQMYLGDATQFKKFSSSTIGGTQAPAVTYDNGEPDLYLIQNWSGNSGGQGFLRIYKITGPVGGESFVHVAFAVSPEPWASSHPIIDKGFAPQFNTNIRITNNDARIGNVVFRNGVITTAHTIFLPAGSPTHSAVQWWRILPTGSVGQRGRIEDPNATLNCGNFYAFPAVAVNSRSDVLVGYSVFNSAIYASAAYSFRFAGDIPWGTIRSSITYRNGLGPYTKDFGSGTVRWGDYSATVVDPQNDIDFWTIQSTADSPTAAGTSRWDTWWAKVVPTIS